MNPPNARGQDGGVGGFNTAEGSGALYTIISNSGNTGDGDTAIGFDALFFDTSGSDNTAVGAGAMNGNTTGAENTAVGSRALESNNGSGNTGVGYEALQTNYAGRDNTANGNFALRANQSGVENTAIGSGALSKNNRGGDNTATGIDALALNVSGSSNTAGGAFALYSNAGGSFNTANGQNALRNNTGGSSNVALGIQALNNNTSGSLNVALGALAGQNLTTGNNNIDIGANVAGKAGEANTIRMGLQGTQKSTFIAGISGTALNGTQVVVTSSGKLGVAPSSVRFKKQISPMEKASETILKLHPVTFRYQAEVDPEQAPQFGLVAEEVEKVSPDLVVHDETGNPFTVRYDAVNVMLLNEFLKEHERVEEQRQYFESKLATQEKQIEALTSAVRKLSDAGHTAPQ